MEININENFRITHDGRQNFIIQERKLIKSTKEGVADRHEWQDAGYYGRLDHVCIALINVVLRQSEAKSLQEVLDEWQKLKNDIIRAIREIGDYTAVLRGRETDD